jgi:hypothetical protein
MRMRYYEQVAVKLLIATASCWRRCRHCSGNYEARGASGGKYEARIAIFRILAAVDRFSRISRKVESHQGKSESR